jgi:hypothetical protein
LFDVVLVSDFCLPGGTNASNVEEIRAQAAAGYTTGLVHAQGGIDRPFHPGIRQCLEDGLAELLLGGTPVEARLLTIRYPPVVQRLRDGHPRIAARAKRLVVNQVPFDQRTRRAVYDVPVVIEGLDGRFGPGTVWSPVGPAAREPLAPFLDRIEIDPDDWPGVLDLSEWQVPRTGVGARPVVGRHSRNDVRKWPDTPADVLAAYPDDREIDVRILGGADAPVKLLGYQPANWTVLPFNAVSPARFLAGLDFFVYFHHPDWAETFGRAVMEALASGAVTIVPPYFRGMFGEACVYAEPWEVREIVRWYAERPDEYLARSRQGQELIARRMSHSVHVRRVRALIGKPSGPPIAIPRRRISPGIDAMIVIGPEAEDGEVEAALVAYAPNALVLTCRNDLDHLRECGVLAESLEGFFERGLPPEEAAELVQKRIDGAIGEFAPTEIIRIGWALGRMFDNSTIIAHNGGSNYASVGTAGIDEQLSGREREPLRI